MLLGFLPSWVPFAAIGVLALGLVGGFFALKASWQAEGAAKVIAADQKAVLEQKVKDEKLSTELIANQAAEIASCRTTPRPSSRGSTMRLRPLAAALSCAMLLAACAISSSVPVARMPDASLMLPCQDPQLVDDPDTATDNEVAAERIRVAEAYLACKRRHADLVTFVRRR